MQKNWLERQCVSIGERSQIKKQDINQQLCRKLHTWENLDIGHREYKFRKPKNYNRFLRRKPKTFSWKWYYQTRHKKPRKFWIKKRMNKQRKRQYKCYLCGHEGHIRPKCSELKKPSNEWSRKTQVKN